MIGKLRKKFIILSMTAVLVLITIIVAGMNMINYRAVISEAEETMEVLARNRGTFPVFGKPDGGMPGDGVCQTICPS